jgi:hypothetical protein
MSRRRRWATRGAVVLAALLVAIQFVPVSRTNPPVTAAVPAPPEVASILRRACYDCHSNETHWPWYSRMAPISWWMGKHVREGRDDLNFSEWPILDVDDQQDALEDIAHQIRSDKMPLRSYRLGHPEARLGPAEKDILLRWAGAGEQ